MGQSGCGLTKAVRDSQEQWYAVGGIRPSSGDSVSRSHLRISIILEEGRVECVPVRAPSISVPGPSNLRVSSGKSKQRKISQSPVKRRFEIASPPLSPQQHRVVEDLGLVPLRTASNRAKNHGAVNETEEPLLLSRVDCHSCCYFVSIFENCSLSSYSLLFCRRLQYKTVLPLFSCIY